MKKVAFCTLGCKVNQYETEAMEQLFLKNNYEIVGFNDISDIYVINTCTVTNMADKKSRQMINRAKKNNNKAIIAVVGCYAQAAQDILKNDSTIDIVIGNNMKYNIINIIEEYNNKHNKIQCLIDINKSLKFEAMHISKVNEKTRAYIKIQDGCNQFCSYCIIPYVRGRIRSRDSIDIIDEVKRLANNGYKEIVLTGIHLASYGVDLGNTNLIQLIESINEIKNLQRIRIGSIEPNLITDDFAYRISALEKVCPHFHLSLQSGCDLTLKRMNRKYTTDEYCNKVEILRHYYEEPAITTDIIVGFPGETKDEFEYTYNFISKIKFSDMHIFKYSKRKGTKAADLPNQINESIKNERSKILINIANKLKNEYLNKYLNTKQEVLIEELIEIENEKYEIGHTKEYIKVGIKSNSDNNNEIKCVKMTKIRNNMILGEYVNGKNL